MSATAISKASMISAWSPLATRDANDWPVSLAQRFAYSGFHRNSSSDTMVAEIGPVTFLHLLCGTVATSLSRKMRQAWFMSARSRGVACHHNFSQDLN